MSERTEALMRIIVGIITGIILEIWTVLIQILVVIHWIYVLITGKRERKIAEFCNIWIAQTYKYFRYLTFNTNKRVFPFEKLANKIEPYEK